MQLKQGTLLQGGKYKVDRVLGQGGFGITYLGEQVALGRKVAIKEFFMKEFCERSHLTSHVTPGTTTGEKIVGRFKEKFLKEARLIASFENPHIVRIYDIFEENGTAYYVMERLQNRWEDMGLRLSLENTIDIIKQVGEALTYIHKRNVLHLDIKPSNILFRDNNAVLIDFGISKRYDEAGSQTTSTPTGMSKGYTPIEQINQGVKQFQPATDVYSLGATMYKLLTGVVPPEASDVMNYGLPLEPLQKRQVTESVIIAIKKAMSPAVYSRYQTVGEFLEAIMQDDDVVPVVDVTQKDPEKKKPFLSKTMKWLIGIAVIVAGIITIYMIGNDESATPVPEYAVEEQDSTMQQKEQPDTVPLQQTTPQPEVTEQPEPVVEVPKKIIYVSDYEDLDEKLNNPNTPFDDIEAMEWVGEDDFSGHLLDLYGRVVKYIKNNDYEALNNILESESIDFNCEYQELVRKAVQREDPNLSSYRSFAEMRRAYSQ